MREGGPEEMSELSRVKSGSGREGSRLETSQCGTSGPKPGEEGCLQGSREQFRVKKLPPQGMACTEVWEKTM